MLEAQAKALFSAQRDALSEIFEQQELVVKYNIQGLELKIVET